MATARADRHAGAPVARASAARAVILAGTAVALVLVLAIVLVVLEANASNDLVRLVRDAANFLAGPFDGLFDLERFKV